MKRRRFDVPILIVALVGSYLAAAPRSAPQPVAPTRPPMPVLQGVAEGRDRGAGAGSTTLAGSGRATSAPSPARSPSPTAIAVGTPRPTPRATRSAGGVEEQSASPVRPSKRPARVAPQPATCNVSCIVRSGLASTYGIGWSEWWVALPDSPGWRFNVCGAGGCRELVSHDAGPDRQMQREGRIVDLPVGAFVFVCGVSDWRRIGLCPVTVTLLGRA